ncbi:CaiB/BaiF CoA transferase family protein [Streptomyces sp. NPDC055078]
MTSSKTGRVDGPLAGVRVLDLTGMLAGPFATMLLADMGADVVKIEPPRGDVTRRSLIKGDDGEDVLSGYFQSINRGKGSIVLDLKDPAQREELLALVDVADVLVENYSAGVMERLGLGYESLAVRNPRLVYATVRGFGDPRSGESPYARWPAYDVVAQAMSGFLSITGTEDGTPVKSGPGIGDIYPATILAVGILGALHHAERTGEGQFVDVAMYDSMVSLCERIVYQHSLTGRVPRPQGNSHPFLSPFEIVPSKDGWVAIAAPHDPQWRKLTGLMGCPELADDERFSSRSARARNKAAVREAVETWSAARATAEIIDVLGGQVPMGPVQSAADLMRDPHLKAREMLIELEQPGTDRTVTVAGTPMKFSATPHRVERRGPLLGENSPEEVLARWAER